MTSQRHTMSTKLRSGPGYLLEGIRLINQPGLRRYAVAPVLVNCLVFALVFGAGFLFLDGLFDRFLPGGDGALAVTLRTLAWLLVSIMAGAIVFFCFTAIANIVGAPFNSILSRAVERVRDGRNADSATDRDAVAGFFRIMLNETRKVAYFVGIGLLVWLIPTLLSSFVPGLNVLVGSAVSVVFLAWMNAVEYIDYPMSNRDVDFRAVRRTVAGRRWLSLTFGLSVLAMMAIPIVNLFAMPAAVAGATALWYDNFRDSRAGR